jgi:hypothetical protein
MAGLAVPGGAELTIGDSAGGGRLTVTGGRNSAGIGADNGAGHRSTAGSVIISGGTVTATGGFGGAGIGGGYRSTGGTATENP